MRRPETIERLYIDFDSFFASVEEQSNPALHGKPVAVTPFAEAEHTCVIAANPLAKRRGVKNIMSVAEARAICPDLKLVPQSPEKYVAIHHQFLAVIDSVLPIEAVCSIDELVCKLDRRAIAGPEALSLEIKQKLARQLGPIITASCGFGPNRLIAKIASEMDKPNGLTILSPENLPGRLLKLDLDDIPGIGHSMLTRLNRAGIFTVEHLWQCPPKHLRSIWHNVNGERFYYALHGYDITPEPTKRSMYGHGRVLPPEWRDADNAWRCARLLALKAARRLRRANMLACRLGLWIKMRDDSWQGEVRLDYANDDQAVVHGLFSLWQDMLRHIPARARIVRLNVALYKLATPETLQPDLFNPDRSLCTKWDRLSQAMDSLNQRYARTMISMGPWDQPPGGYAGGKIAFTRVPKMEDFW